MPKVDRELAKMLYPKPADVVQEAMGGKAQAAYAYGTAASDSDSGTVTVVMEGETAGVDAAIEVPTSCAISEGDTVLVSVSGNVPVEAVSKGSGDETRSIASEALDVANATKQYFWHDDAGAHVSTEALNPTGPSNSLWNSLGLLIRKAANNLVSITQSAIAFYDGNGNNTSNVVATFGSSGSQVGKTAEPHISIGASSVTFNSGTEDLLSIKAGTYGSYIQKGDSDLYVGNRDNGASAIESFLLNRADTADNLGMTKIRSRLQNGVAEVSCQVENSDELKAGTVSVTAQSPNGDNYARITTKASNTATLIAMDATDVDINSRAPLVIDYTDITVGSIDAGSNFSSSVSIAKSYYTPIAIAWQYFTAGTRQNWFYDYGTHIQGTTLYIRLCNVHASSAASGTLRVYTLYAADALV